MHTAIATPVVMPCRTDAARSARPALRDVSRQATSCLGCSLRRICMPVEGEDPEAKALFEQLVATRIRLRKGDVLYRAGERFTALYAIRLGSCKTVVLTGEGSERLSAYHLPGEIVGTEGMGHDAHTAQVVALEDSEVCAMPHDRIEGLARQDATFQRRIHRLLSDAIVRERNNALMLGTMRAEQRLAAFLLDLSQRYQARGYSSTEFVLRMTREEIGSHLGLKLETVSRLFSRFDEEGLVLVQGRIVKLLDRIGLQQLIAAA